MLWMFWFSGGGCELEDVKQAQIKSEQNHGTAHPETSGLPKNTGPNDEIAHPVMEQVFELWVLWIHAS